MLGVRLHPEKMPMAHMKPNLDGPDRATEWAVRVSVAAIFTLTGLEKFLPGAQTYWVHVFDAIGFGQWFRYFTGAVEVAGGVLFLEVVSKPSFVRLRGKHPLSERGGDESRADRCAVGADCSIAPEAQGEAEGRTTARRGSRVYGRDSLGAAHRRPMEGHAGSVSRVCGVLAPPRRVGACRRVAVALARLPRRLG